MNAPPSTPFPLLQLVIILVALALTTVAVKQVRDLPFNGDIYALLGSEDAEFAVFRDLDAQAPELDALVMVCDPGVFPGEELLERLRKTEGVGGDPDVFVRPGKSSAYAFPLSRDSSDFAAARPVVDALSSSIRSSGLACGLTGTPAVVVESQQVINADLQSALALAGLLAFLLFAFVYRIGVLALLLLVPVVAGILWGVAAYSLLRGELTLLAATVPTLLIGVGIDHCIHMIQGTRYAIRSESAQRDVAVVRTWRRLVLPITIATLTTITAFAALAFADLGGLADLGWSGALVTAGVYAACMMLMPVILLHAPAAALMRDVPLEKPMTRLARGLGRHGRAAAAVLLVAALAGAIAATSLDFLSDNRELEVGDLSSREYQARLAAEHGLTPTPLLMLFEDPDNHVELLAEPERPDGIANILPVQQVPGLLQIHAVDNPFERQNYEKLVDTIAEWTSTLELSPYELTGGPAMNARLDALAKQDAARVIPLAFALVLVTLAIGSRSLLWPFVLLVPLAVALALLAGVLKATGVAFSLMTAAIIPLVLGIGVDSSVHFVASWLRRNGDLASVYAESGLAIVVTTLTSIAAFSAFIPSVSPALVQFGWQAAVALLGGLAGTLVLLPLLARRLSA